MLGAQGLLAPVRHTDQSWFLPQTHQKGKEGSHNHLSLAGVDKGLGSGELENALSQLEQSIQKGFLEEAVSELGPDKPGDQTRGRGGRRHFR